MKLHRSRPRGFSLLELTIAITVVIIAGGISYSVLNSTFSLYAKNVALNLSGDSMRRAIDRLLLDIQTSNSVPVLINPSGAVVTSGSAAGLRYDSYLGGPYVLNHPDNGSSLAANATVIRLYRHTHPLASPPIPEPDDVLVVSGYENSRFVIASVTTGTYAADSTQTITLTLRAATGTAINLAHSTVPAYLLRQKAIVVASANGALELRVYPRSERVANYALASNYQVFARSLHSANDGSTPFSIQVANGLPHVRINLSVRDNTSGGYFTGKQKADANDYLFINTSIRPKMTL